MDKICFTRTKPRQKFTRMRALGIWVDIGLRVHEILLEYWGI